MSLLLDALKKAAQEKERTTSAETGSAAAEHKTTASIQNNAEVNSNKDEIELSLHEMEADEQAPSSTQPEQQDAEELSVEPELELELEKTRTTTSTVSDEALQFLVYKTNKQYRRSQKLIWGSALIAGMILLILGGVYYYFIMAEEVEALNVKHRIAMQAFELHQLPESPKKPSYMEPPSQPSQVMSVNNTGKSKVTAPQIKRAISQQRSSDTFSVQRTQKRDPVGSLLNKAWLAYSDKNYPAATDAYKRVLEREPRNRDALLGKAAIAIKQGDYVQARSVYNKLLSMDPRDQIAMSALSNLEQAAPDAMGESRLKFMLQQQPDAAHLHFALGNYYAKQIKWPEAQSEYFSAWQGNSDNADYAFNLAVSLDQLGKRNEAARFYEKSLALSTGKNISFSVESVKRRLEKLQRVE